MSNNNRSYQNLQHCVTISLLTKQSTAFSKFQFSRQNPNGDQKVIQNKLRQSLYILVIVLVGFNVPALADVTQQLVKPTISTEAKQNYLAETDAKAMDILTYWFEEWQQDLTQGGKGRYNDKWFPHGPLGAEGSKETDRIIREKFLPTFELAIADQLGWDIQTNPYENLAYIILLDQFTRNMFRGTDAAYAHDNLSRAAAKTNIENGFHRYYFTGYQKLFVVYPLMHHENLASQEISLRFLKAINEHSEHPYEFLNALQKGVEHYQVIYMFGRFPHRNPRRDRDNTLLETQYLNKKGTAGFVDGSKW